MAPVLCSTLNIAPEMNVMTTTMPALTMPRGMAVRNCISVTGVGSTAWYVVGSTTLRPFTTTRSYTPGGRKYVRTATATTIRNSRI